MASIHPKPITQGDWNGAGMHINFSTEEMRVPEKDGKGGLKSIIQAIDRLGARHAEHIAVYGKYTCTARTFIVHVYCVICISS